MLLFNSAGRQMALCVEIVARKGGREGEIERQHLLRNFSGPGTVLSYLIYNFYNNLMGDFLNMFLFLIDAGNLSLRFLKAAKPANGISRTEDSSL